MEHPFWCNGLVMTDPKDIASILASSIKEVWIDCDKGTDGRTGEPAVTEAESERGVDATLKQLALGQRHVAPLNPGAGNCAGDPDMHQGKACADFHVRESPHWQGCGYLWRPQIGGGNCGFGSPQSRRTDQLGAAQNGG
jgi:hypothetical protein